MSQRLVLAGSLAAMLVAAGCGETFISISSDGRLEIIVRTTGNDLDRDGFTISVDGGREFAVAGGSEVTLSDLDPGTHSVQLAGLADNCRVEGSNPRSVVVGADGTASVGFEVRCARATTGGFTIVVTTAGPHLDPDGYSLAVAGGEIRAIGFAAVETFTGLSPGAHLVTLKDVDGGCTVPAGNPRPFTVSAGLMVEVRLEVVCAGGGLSRTTPRGSSASPG
ncbi:MAG TPA: hypothetical protein VMY76_05000 [Gemmatimonadales bacterium]|nr:hypothetical protein [Gemmatimonadales bacterium]